MKTMSIYSQRVELNNWEILGIESYLKENFNLFDEFIYSDKTIHADGENNRFGIYKISHGEDLYITLFYDEGENITFRLNLSSDNFYQLDNDFNFIAEFDNIFEL